MSDSVPVSNFDCVPVSATSSGSLDVSFETCDTLVLDKPSPVEYDVEVGQSLNGASGETSTPVTDQAVVAGQLGSDQKEVTVLLDSGATGCFISRECVKSRQLKTFKYSNPRKLTLFDGQPSSSGPIVEFVEEEITVDGFKSKVKFDVTLLSGADVVLGFVWLKNHRILIDFARMAIESRPKKKVEFASPISTNFPIQDPMSMIPISDSEVNQSRVPRTHVRIPNGKLTWPNLIPVSEPLKWNTGNSSSGSLITTISMSTSTPKSLSMSESMPTPTPKSKSESTPMSESTSTSTFPPSSEPTSSFPNSSSKAKLWAVVSSDEDWEEIETLPTFSNLALTPEEEDELRETVPEYYRDFLDIFHPRLAKETLPPHRPYDLKFTLKPDAKLKVAPLYELSPDQFKCLKETIEKERAAGRIEASNSPYGSPTFFVPKKDGTYRMVVDYRHINSQTVPDAYPLPLIPQVLSQLAGSRYYSIFDLPGAYQLLRAAEGHEDYTSFRTALGMFKSKVLRDGLKNAPAVFQHFLNEIFAKLIGDGVVVYIDDVLCHAKTLERLREITREVFEIVRKWGLYLKASKSKFEQLSVKFLGFIVSELGISADSGYVQGVLDFPVPETLKQTRRFLGMASYYRRFVPNFGQIARPLHHLTKAGVQFEWTQMQQDAFDKLKSVMCKAPVLAYFNPLAETIVQTDASFFGWGFVISQIDPETRQEHPIAIESGAFKGAELNYTTTEKEFLAIVEAFRRKRHILLQVNSLILTDHLNLTYWMEPRVLNGRQARWVDLLSSFSFRIVYRPGPKNVFPDALSRRPDYSPNSDDEPNLVQALPNLDMVSNTDTQLRHLLRATLPVVEDELDEEPRNGLLDLGDVKEGIEHDEDLSTVRVELKKNAVSPEDSPDLKLSGFSRRLGIESPVYSFENGLLRINNRLYVPDFKNLRLSVLSAHHDSILAGHQGVSKTLELIQRGFCWLGLRRDVENYVRGCAICQRTKPVRQRPQGFLQSLEVADGPWSSISMDFIEELPNSNGYNSILVVVDRLTKWAVFIPTTTTLKAAGLADLIIDHIICQHGIPRSIISDRGSKFTSRVWGSICSILGIKVSLSTAFHPQTDGQTERVNQVLEQYLRVFTNYKQDNWSSLLQRAAFAYNNSEHSGIKMSPFYANFGYSARWISGLDLAESIPEPVVEKAKSLVEVHELCRDNINLANRDYAKYYNAKRRTEKPIDVGDSVLLSLQNVKTRRPSKKLDIRWSGPYRVSAKVGNLAYRLELPASMKIHNVFHISLLRHFESPVIPGQSYDPPGPVETDDLEESWEIRSILDSRIVGNKLMYEVEWLGYEGTDLATSWEPESNVEGSRETVESFHSLNPLKPRPSDLPTKGSRRSKSRR